ncbi:hypothetical protein [Pseudothermotoga sp.]|nr:hypothetical protein [Pseudothermotoga sp.]MCX7812034.1 hypothetical protein [Pseudothermotoga sp.]MDW8139104.1 hypothetical protein [Pseudothermotoga sp.]
MAFEVGKLDLFGRKLNIVQQNGVLYYIGETEPASDDILLIKKWMQLPLVTLAYDGPSELKGVVESCLNSVGVLVGIADVLYTKVRKQSGLIYTKLIYRDWQWDNSDELWKEEDFSAKLVEKLRELFSFIEFPEAGYSVLVADRIIFEKRIGQTKPVEIKVPEKIVSLTVNGERKLLSEGFYNLFGKVIYIDEDTTLAKTSFFEGAKMVYKTSKGYVIYRDGSLTFPDGKSIVAQEPFDVVDDRIIPWRVMVKSEGSSFQTTVVGRSKDLLVLSCGMIAPLDLSWFMRVSGPIIEWVCIEQRLYVLDIAGYVRSFDLKSRRLIWEKLVPGAWGLAVHKGEVYVASGEKLLQLNEKGEPIQERYCQDFGVSQEGIIALIEKKGRFIRSADMSVLLEGSKATVYADQIFRFDGISVVRFFDWGVVLVGESGCWVVERR